MALQREICQTERLVSRLFLHSTMFIILLLLKTPPQKNKAFTFKGKNYSLYLRPCKLL